MEELLQFLGRYHALSAELQVSLMSVLQKEVHRSNKFLLEEGQICDWIAYIESGLVKVYIERETGEETILWVYKEGDIISAMQSYHYDAPSILSIRTMEETVIRRIRKPALEQLYQRFPEFNIAARRIAEASCCAAERRLVYGALKLKERYQRLLTDNAWLLSDRRIKEYLIASMLHVDKATYSRMKKPGI